MSTATVPADAQSVQIAVRLGWRLAEAYHTPPPPHPAAASEDAPVPDRLPGGSRLSMYERGRTLLAEIQHDATQLASAYGFTLASAAGLAGLPASDAEATRRTLLSVHQDLRRALACANSHAVRGFDLGRMLADTVLLADAHAPAGLAELFGHDRLENAYGWLGDLHRLLPDHSADAVAGSLHHWEQWVTLSLVPPRGADAPMLLGTAVVRALHHQGELWRRLLCGDRQAVDLLTARDYKQAGDRVARRFLGLVGSYALSWWYMIAGLLVVAGATIWAILDIVPRGGASTAAIIATVAASLGISWKTVGATLGRVTARAEGPIWDTEVGAAIVIAATHLPPPVDAPAPGGA